jgi:hypothetical protein
MATKHPGQSAVATAVVAALIIAAANACSDDGTVTPTDDGASGSPDGSSATDAAAPRDSSAPNDSASPNDASLDGPGDAEDSDSAPSATFSRCALQDGGAAIDAGAVWENDFSTGDVADPAGDDTGSGTYRYPADIDPPVDGGAGLGGVADLIGFRLSYSAASQALTVAARVRRLTEHTRVGVVLYDRAHFPDADAGALTEAQLEWAVTGTELRLPNWSDGAVTFLLAKPPAQNPTFDLAVRRNLAGFGSETRPDNAVYVRRDAWLGCDGRPLAPESRFDILELPVADDGAGTLSFTLPAATLAGELDLRSPKLYAVVYTYVLADRANKADVEFGALELTEELGGLTNASTDSWREPDTYDVGFVTSGTQASLLTPPPVPDGGFTANDGTKLVVVKDVGRGVLAIDTDVVR